MIDSRMVQTLKGRVYDAVLNPFLRYLVAPALSAGPGISRIFVDVPEVQVPTAVVGLLLTSVGNYGAFREEGRKERRADARAVLRTLLQSLVKSVDVTGDEGVRANIMLWDAHNGGFRMAYMTDGYTFAEKELVWREEEGCVGRAYSQRKTVVYPEDEGGVTAELDHADAPTRPWGMRRTQIVTTANRVRSAICTPVPNPHHTGEVIGILSMDSERMFEQSRLSQRGAVVEGLRDAVGRVLDRAGLKFPDDDADVIEAGRSRRQADQ